MRILRRPGTAGLIFVIAVFELLAFALIAVRPNPLDWVALGIGGCMVCLFLITYLLLTTCFPHIDRYVIIIVNFLVALGMIMQYRLTPETGMKQIVWFCGGQVGMFAVILILQHIKKWQRYLWPMILCSVGLLSITLVLGVVRGGARNWIAIASFTFQPSEFAKVLLIMILAIYLDKTSSIKKLLPLGLFVACAVVLLVVAKDLGAALLFFLTSVTLYFVATSNFWLTGLMLLAGAGGSIAAYKLFSHVRVRVQIWQNPWLLVEASGYQIVQGLMAIASGGLFGLGLYQGSPKHIPAYHTDFIFAVLCEEFGIIAGVIVIILFMVLVLRGASIALNASNKTDALMALGCCTMLAYQTFIIIGGVIKLIPLTGITLPFISYGGSSMLTNMIIIGVLESIAIKNGKANEAQRDVIVT